MKNKVPLILVFCLFFLWAISSNLLPTMIRQLMKTCELNTFDMKRMYSILATVVISTIATAQVSSPKVNVEFVSPKIVRVQWSADGALPGNDTGVCVY